MKQVRVVLAIYLEGEKGIHDKVSLWQYLDEETESNIEVLSKFVNDTINDLYEYQLTDEDDDDGYAQTI